MTKPREEKDSEQMRRLLRWNLSTIRSDASNLRKSIDDVYSIGELRKDFEKLVEMSQSVLVQYDAMNEQEDKEVEAGEWDSPQYGPASKRQR